MNSAYFPFSIDPKSFETRSLLAELEQANHRVAGTTIGFDNGEADLHGRVYSLEVAERLVELGLFARVDGAADRFRLSYDHEKRHWMEVDALGEPDENRGITANDFIYKHFLRGIELGAYNDLPPFTADDITEFYDEPGVGEYVTQRLVEDGHAKESGASFALYAHLTTDFVAGPVSRALNDLVHVISEGQFRVGTRLDPERIASAYGISGAHELETLREDLVGENAIFDREDQWVVRELDLSSSHADAELMEPDVDFDSFEYGAGQPHARGTEHGLRSRSLTDV